METEKNHFIPAQSSRILMSFPVLQVDGLYWKHTTICVYVRYSMAALFLSKKNSIEGNYIKRSFGRSTAIVLYLKMELKVGASVTSVLSCEIATNLTATLPTVLCNQIMRPGKVV